MLQMVAETKEKITRMLKTKPEYASFRNMSMWLNSSPMTLPKFEAAWYKIEPTIPMFDWANTEYAEWENDSWQWFGMRFKEE